MNYLKQEQNFPKSASWYLFLRDIAMHRNKHKYIPSVTFPVIARQNFQKTLKIILKLKNY